jgi:hypothetical protein
VVPKQQSGLNGQLSFVWCSWQVSSGRRLVDLSSTLATRVLILPLHGILGSTQAWNKPTFLLCPALTQSFVTLQEGKDKL